MLEALDPQTLGQKALEARGCEHVQVPGFEVMAPRRWLLPLHHRDVHLGRLEGRWVLSHPGGLGTHQFHRRGLLGSSVGLDGETSGIRLLEGSRPKEAPLLGRASVLIPTARVQGAGIWAR